MNTIAIITARGGSKRIPRKNIKEFMGKPMITYAIDAALKSNVFDEVMVSTDDFEIAEIAKKNGAKVPFMRSKKTANDMAMTYDVLEEVIDEYQKIGRNFDNLACIYPCVPFLKSETLQNAYQIFINSNCDTLVPVVKFSFPIQRAFREAELPVLWGDTQRYHWAWPSGYDPWGLTSETGWGRCSGGYHGAGSWTVGRCNR